jgi:hypothetical protein
MGCWGMVQPRNRLASKNALQVRKQDSSEFLQAEAREAYPPAGYVSIKKISPIAEERNLY